MPEYTYICTVGHTFEIAERMLYTTGRVCQACGQPMRRKPQTHAVNWGMLRPSQGELSATVRDLIDTAPERRERYQERHPK
jgi:hypothetical protein